MITAYQAAVKLAQIGREHEQRWAGVRLRAERKMGELLGPAERGNPTLGDSNVSATHIDAAERTARKEARKLAAVPEDVFTAYVETAEEPTRAGLLREALHAVENVATPEEADRLLRVALEVSQ